MTKINICYSNFVRAFVLLLYALEGAFVLRVQAEGRLTERWLNAAENGFVWSGRSYDKVKFACLVPCNMQARVKRLSQ
ncbi:MAG: hypothetical protein ACAF41_11240 [Leptolyngbya sp. BL-A-14]